MIFGIGLDLIEVARFDKHVKEETGLIERVFTQKEIAYCAGRVAGSQNFAGRFAAKEAFLKALGTGLREGFSWHDMEVVNNDLGKPEFVVSGKVREFTSRHSIFRFHLSISHVKEFAAAYVLLEAGEPSQIQNRGGPQ